MLAAKSIIVIRAVEAVSQQNGNSPCSKQLVLVGSQQILECGDETEIAAITDNVSLHDLLMYLDCLIHTKGSAIVQLFPILRVI